MQTRWRGQLSTQQGASTPFISDSLLRKLSASLLLSFTLTAQKTFIFHSFIFPPLFSPFTATPCSQNVFLMAITHKNNLPLVMDLNVSQAYATSVSPKIWRCRWAGYTAIIVTCGKHNCCLFWVKRARGNIIQTWGKRTNTDRNVNPTPWVACVNLGVEQQTQQKAKQQSKSRPDFKWDQH